MWVLSASEQEAGSWLIGEAKQRGFGSVEPEVQRERLTAALRIVGEIYVPLVFVNV